jgi:hypothetical protein
MIGSFACAAIHGAPETAIKQTSAHKKILFRNLALVIIVIFSKILRRI